LTLAAISRILASRLADLSPELQVFGNMLLQETGGESLPEWILLQVSIFVEGPDGLKLDFFA